MASHETSLRSLLETELPKGSTFTFYHISTPPTKCDAIFAALPQSKPERTYCESHLLNVSIAPAGDLKNEELLILAIEIQIYTTRNLTTIFVSKADTTGFLSIAGLPRSKSTPARAISQTFVSYLAQTRQRDGKRLVVSLFARAQDQYLFPGSIDNGLKHVLDDRGLIKWWCRVLDPVIKQYAQEKEPTIEDLENGLESDEDKVTAQGYLIVPGVERSETIRYFPAPRSQWAHGHPLQQIALNPNAPPRCLVPHFPDDPKARYMDELDAELPERNSKNLITPTRSDGQWKSIKTLDQFWELMSFRQECSSGRLVGFIWVVITPPNLSSEDDAASTIGDSQISFFSMAESSPPKKTPKSLRNTYSPARGPRRAKKRLTGPIIPRLPRIKSASSTSSSASQPESTPYYFWPQTGRGEIVLSQKEYQRALDLLLKQNFMTREHAARSSESWTKEVGLLAGKEGAKWGWKVLGKQEVEEAFLNPTAASNGVNTLDMSSMRKKRKVEVDEHGQSEGQPQILSAGLVRKKPKPDEAERSQPVDSGVNTLSANLVRKKPKT